MSKYHAIRSGTHASKKEAKRSQELHLMQQLGLIEELEEQVKYELLPKQDGERAVTYTADFRYKENGVTVVEDSKGMKTQQYILRRKMMLYFHGVKIKET